jgi:hypothetical protein
MEPIFDFLSALELHSRLLNVRIARESFKQNQRLLVRHLFLVFASDRERRGEGVQLRRSLFLARRDCHQFRHLRPQGLKISSFRFRIINRLFGKLGPPMDRFWSISSCCWIVAEKLAAAFTSTSKVALANADVARAKKTIARNIRSSGERRHCRCRTETENYRHVLASQKRHRCSDMCRDVQFHKPSGSGIIGTDPVSETGGVFVRCSRFCDFWRNGGSATFQGSPGKA